MSWAEQYKVGGFAKVKIIGLAVSMIGSTVTVTNGSDDTKSAVMDSNNTATVMVFGKGRYTATCGTFSQSFTLNSGEYKEIELGYETSTWEGIKKIVDDGKTANYFHVGDTKTVVLSTGESVVLEVAGIGTYASHELTFISRNCLTGTKQMNTSNTNAGGWNSSALRNWLNNTLLTYLPEDLQAVIAEKPLKRSIGSQSTALQSANDKLWVPTEFEVFGAITYAAGTEAAVQAQYPIFTDAASRVKTLGEHGSACNWWESSPLVGNSTDFCAVNSSGAVNGYYAGASAGVPLCFCIRQSA